MNPASSSGSSGNGMGANVVVGPAELAAAPTTMDNRDSSTANYRRLGRAH